MTVEPIKRGLKRAKSSEAEIQMRWAFSSAPSPGAESPGICNLRQGLVEGAVRASSPAMGAAIRRVLDGLHREKADAGVDAMLLRLYEPILFR